MLDALMNLMSSKVYEESKETNSSEQHLYQGPVNLDAELGLASSYLLSWFTNISHVPQGLCLSLVFSTSANTIVSNWLTSITNAPDRFGKGD